MAGNLYQIILLSLLYCYINSTIYNYKQHFLENTIFFGTLFMVYPNTFNHFIRSILTERKCIELRQSRGCTDAMRRRRDASRRYGRNHTPRKLYPRFASKPNLHRTSSVANRHETQRVLQTESCVSINGAAEIDRNIAISFPAVSCCRSHSINNREAKRNICRS